MKVKCSNISGPAVTSEGGDGWITPGKTYLVLGIYGREGSIKYRILGDDGEIPALHEASYFDFVDNKIPDDWEFILFKSGTWELSPASFNSPNFWENYFDGELSARTNFANVYALLKESR